MRRKLGITLLALGAGVALLVSGAVAGLHGESTPRSRSAADQRGGTLRLMWGTEPDSLDPALASGTIGSWVLLNATCAKLFRTVRDPDTGMLRVVPEVVRRTTVSNSGRTYTFELKRTFRFHTGARVTAQSFAAAFDRNANPLLRSPVTRQGFMQQIVGADAAMRGTAKTISGVRPLGRYRLRISLKSPTGDFIAGLTMPYFCPISPGTPSRPIDRPPGSGPYYFANHDPNRRIVLERNPHYRGGRTANPDRIVWTIKFDYEVRVRATERGENDFLPLFGQPNPVVRDLIEKYGLNRPGGRVLRDSPTLANFLFRFNTDRPAFKGAGQAPLRKAINYALDRRALARAHGHQAVSPSDRLLPAALSKRRPLYPLQGPDPVTALKVLARAGQQPPQTLTLYTATYAFSIPVAQVFVANMKQLGIRVEVTPVDPRTLGEKLATPGEPWDVALLPWRAAYPHPAGALVPLLRGTRYEAQINAANRMSGAARDEAWADLEAELMADDPPVAAYADFTPLAFVSRRNFGCWSGADANLDLATVCKK
jgi:ABC-type transport system substrate-binding protein